MPAARAHDDWRAPRPTRWQRLRRRLRPPRRLRFTGDGRIFALLAVGIGFAAVNTGNNLLYLLLGWMLSFIIASGVLSELTLRGLSVERVPPPRIYASEPFLMEVVIENSKVKSASYSVEVEDLAGGQPIDKRCYFLKIPPKRLQRTSYRHTFSRRGLYRLSGYRIATRFPFSLFRKSRDVDAPLEFVVHPARAALPHPPIQTMNRGESPANRMGRRGEFFGLRERRAGDDHRDIHWRSSARTGRMLVREYEDELAQRVVIAVDTAVPDDVRAAADRRGSPFREDADDAVPQPARATIAAVERAISVAAGLASMYLELGWTVELAARGCRVPPGTGPAHEARISRALALLPYTSDETPFPPLPPRVESVLVIAFGVYARGRPLPTELLPV